MACNASAHAEGIKNGQITHVLIIDMIMQGGRPKLQEGDAVLIARSWFEVGTKVSVNKVAEDPECDDLGLVPLEEQMKLRAALAHLGNELVDK